VSKEEDDFALKAATAEPFWVRAPLILGLGIVGVPSLIAIATVYFVAQTVIHNQRILVQYELSELSQLSQMDVQDDTRWNAIRGYIADDLRAQYQTCIHAAKTNVQRVDCLTPQARLEEYGIATKKK
jgi:hypothetical protein